MQPRTDGARMLVAGIPTGDLVAIASSPNDIGIGQIRNGEAGLATAHAMIPSCFLRVHGHAGAAHVSIVLHIAIEVVRNLVVDVYVVHLADWKCHAMESATVNCSNEHSRVIGDYETIRVGWINPDIVSVAAPVDFLKILPSVERLVEGAVGNVNFVVGSGRNRNSNVVASASNQGPLEIDGLPDRALILGLNQGENTLGVCRSDSDVDLADRSMRQAVLFDASPLRSAIA